MSFRYSTEEFKKADQDYLYYNADIINNTSTDLGSSGLAQPDPPIRFNEARDAPLIRDSSKWHMSIVRFTMDGPGRNLPLLIPSIKLGQSNPNLTSYSFAIAFQATYVTNIGNVYFEIQPTPTPLIWVPENQNPIIAPTPAPPLTTQDLSSRYYYLNTYQWMVNLVNQTLTTAVTTLYNEFKLQWQSVASLTDVFPYATLADFTGAVFNVPQFSFDSSTSLFTVWMDSRAFGNPIVPFVATPYSAGNAELVYSPVARMFMNTNAGGLFANFPLIYWNSLAPLPSISVGGVTLPAFTTTTQPGYVWEFTVPNKFYQNVQNFTQPPYGNPGNIVPIPQQQVYYQVTQDFPSIDSIWSPIASIVFTTSLVPVRPEQVAAPTIYGTGNIGNSSSTAASAFTPIITDVALDTTVGGSAAYKQFVSYVPSGEYRISDFTGSGTSIQQLDIQVFWKNRLDGQLYPIYMYNLSSVSLKLMFRAKSVD